MKKNVLFFITAAFPYGKGETFIENELPYLETQFDKIIIIHGAENEYNRRTLGKKIILKKIVYNQISNRFFVLMSIFRYSLYKELYDIIFVFKKKISSGILKTTLVSLYNANKLKKEYENFILKQSKHKNVFLYSYWFNDSAHAISLIKQKHPHFKVCTRVHRWDLYFNESKYNYLPYRRSISENLDQIFSISNDGIRYCKDEWRLKSAKNLSVSRLGIKKQNTITPSTENHVIVSCSNIIQVKRLDRIIETLSQINTKNVQWFHFGTGPLKEQMNKMAEKKLQGIVDYHFMGHKSNSSLLVWYKTNLPSLFINLSDSEGVPVSIMEAMSFGIPCIATDVGGTSELVNKDNGDLIKSTLNPSEISSKIDSFFALEFTTREKMAFSAQKKCDELYSAEINFNHFSNVLKAL
jgi:colanic acid/amylovoran biosynthesis glycosyltransferase